MSKKMFSVYFSTLFLTLICCSKSDDGLSGPNPLLTNKLEAINFTINAPSDWDLIMDKGTDTYIGRITNHQQTIFFDQGFLSFKGLDDIVQTSNTVSLEELKIDGVPSIIHKEKTPEGIRISVYIDAGDNIRMNRFYILEPKDEELVLSILRTHRFKSELNPI